MLCSLSLAVLHCLQANHHFTIIVTLVHTYDIRVLHLVFAIPASPHAVDRPFLTARLPNGTNRIKRNTRHAVIAPISSRFFELVGKFLQLWLEFLAANFYTSHKWRRWYQHIAVCIASLVKHYRQETDVLQCGSPELTVPSSVIVDAVVDAYKSTSSWSRSLELGRELRKDCLGDFLVQVGSDWDRLGEVLNLFRECKSDWCSLIGYEIEGRMTIYRRKCRGPGEYWMMIVFFNVMSIVIWKYATLLTR